MYSIRGFAQNHNMPLLSRLFGKKYSTDDFNPPKGATPSPTAGSFSINIDASQHIVQAVTVFRNNTAQVVRTFHDLTLKVRHSLSEGGQTRAKRSAFWSPVGRKHSRNR